MKNNKAVSEVDLKDVLDLHKKDVMLSMNCHAIGEIQSFDSSKQTCVVKISYCKTFYDRDSSGKYVPRYVDYPVLVDCPTVVLSGGLAGLSMPIKQGDSCLVLFCDRDIDNWFNGAKSGPPASNRLHSISDGVALVGLRSPANKIPNYDADNPTLYNEGTRVKVKTGKVEIANDSDKLGLLLADLIDAINSITTTNCVVGSPVAISPASQASISSVKAKLQGLLE